MWSQGQPVASGVPQAHLFLGDIVSLHLMIWVSGCKHPVRFNPPRCLVHPAEATQEFVLFLFFDIDSTAGGMKSAGGPSSPSL